MIIYLKNHEDAEETKKLVEREGRKCLTIAGDLSERKFCSEVISKTISTFRKLDILVNHHGVQHLNTDFASIDDEQIMKTFQTNVFSYMFLIKDAIPHLKPGSVIINTSSVTAFKGKKELVDYSATNGAIVSLTRALALQLAPKGIRVNSVAPGPIWTPFIPASFPKEKLESFGKHVPLKRAGQPIEVAPSYVFLASTDSSYMTGQIMHPNGGTLV